MTDRLYPKHKVGTATIRDLLAKARAVLLKRGVSPDDAEDLVHEAFLRMCRYEQAHVVRSREAVLIRTAVNISIDAARQRRRSLFVGASDTIERIVDLSPQPDVVARARAQLRHARVGLDRLPERSRRILLSRRLDDLSVADIAQREGMTVAAVEKQIARATLHLMRWMDGW